MEDFKVFLSWLTDSGMVFVANLLSFIFGLVIMIVQLKKYKLFKNQTKENNMEYRVASYREKTDSPSQSFDTEVDQYRLNKSTNELEKLPDKLDIQQLVQSAEQQSLSNLLQHLEPPVTELDEVVDVHNELLTSLDIMRDADNFRSEMCAKYGLSPKTSLDDVIKTLQAQEVEVRSSIANLAKPKSKKEEVVNEKEELSSQQEKVG